MSKHLTPGLNTNPLRLVFVSVIAYIKFSPCGNAEECNRNDVNAITFSPKAMFLFLLVWKCAVGQALHKHSTDLI